MQVVFVKAPYQTNMHEKNNTIICLLAQWLTNGKCRGWNCLTVGWCLHELHGFPLSTLHRKFVLAPGQQWTCWHLQNIWLSHLATAALWQGNSLAAFYCPFAFVPHDMTENLNLPGPSFLYILRGETTTEWKIQWNWVLFWCKNFAVLPITAWSSPVTTYVSAAFLRSLVHRLLQNCKKWSFTLLSHPKNHLEVLFHSPNAVLRT